MASQAETTNNKVQALETSGQWPTWSKAVKEALGIAGYGRLLPGATAQERPTRREEERTEDFAIRLDKWEDKSDKACALIRSKLSNDADARVKPSTKKPLDTVKDLWATIENKYKPRGRNEFRYLHRQWSEASKESCGGVVKFASRLRELNAEMGLIHAKSKWPTSHVVQKFLDGLGSDFDLWLTTWEPNNTPIDETNSQNVVTRTAVTLEQATGAAVEFETAQKQREKGAAFLAQHAALLAQKSPSHKLLRRLQIFTFIHIYTIRESTIKR